MKHGKKPSREQRKMLDKYHLDAADWLVVKDTPEVMVIVHRFHDGTMRFIPKGEYYASSSFRKTAEAHRRN